MVLFKTEVVVDVITIEISVCSHMINENVIHVSWGQVLSNLLIIHDSNIGGKRLEK